MAKTPWHKAPPVFPGFMPSGPAEAGVAPPTTAPSTKARIDKALRSPADHFTHSTVGRVTVWIIGALAIGSVILVGFAPDGGIHNAPVRDLSDPLVVTHLFALPAIFIAIASGMPLFGTFLAAVTITSLFYHIFAEHQGVVADIDRWLAATMIVAALFIFGVSLTLHPNGPFSVLAALLAIVAVIAYVRSHDVDNMAQQENLHALWHFFGFLALAGVAANMHRGPTTQFAAPGTWLHSAQTFSY